MTRTEHDTWDTTSSVGATATGCAAVRALASRQSHPLIDDPFAAALVQQAGVDAFTQVVDGQLAPSDVFGPLAPAIIDSMAVRTASHDYFALDRVAQGTAQVVMLASGLDTRAYRLAWTSGTTVFDVDLESVTTFKSTTLAALGFSPSSDHRPVGADLRYDWATRLLAAGFDPGKRAVWLVEGLLPYLPPDAQDALLDNITGLSAPDSALIIESVTDARSPEHDEFQAELDQVSERQRQQGHDLDIGTLMYEGDRHETASYLNTAGWTTTQVSATELFASCGRPLAHGERPFPDGRTVLATKG